MFLFPGLISLVDGYRVLPGFSEGPIASADLFPRFTEFLRNLVAKLFVFDVVYRVLPGFPKVLRLRVYRVSFKRLASLVDDYRVLPGFSFPRVLRIRVFTEFFFFWLPSFTLERRGRSPHSDASGERVQTAAPFVCLRRRVELLTLADGARRRRRRPPPPPHHHHHHHQTATP